MKVLVTKTLYAGMEDYISIAGFLGGRNQAYNIPIL
jgi:hypothetical protein